MIAVEDDMETIVTSNGRIVIPASIRLMFGIKEGTHIHIAVDEKSNRIILKPITRKYIHSLRGRFRGKGLLKALMAGKKRERKI